MNRTSLTELEKGIKGLVVMSSSLEEMFQCIHDARVPPLWEKVRLLLLEYSIISSSAVKNTVAMLKAKEHLSHVGGL